MDVSTQRLINYTTRANGVDQLVRYRTSRVLVNEEADPQPRGSGPTTQSRWPAVGFYITPSLAVTYELFHDGITLLTFITHRHDLVFQLTS